jgi:hypothetical protein
MTSEDACVKHAEVSEIPSASVTQTSEDTCVKHAEVANEALVLSIPSEGTSGKTSEDACAKHSEVSKIPATSEAQTSEDAYVKHAEVGNEALASSIEAGVTSEQGKDETSATRPEVMQGGQLERDAQKKNQEELRMQHNDLKRKAIRRIPLVLMRMNTKSWSRETIFAHTEADYVHKQVENETDSGYIYEEITKFMEYSSRSDNLYNASKDYVNMIRDFYTKGMSRQQFEDSIGYLYIKCIFNADVTHNAYVDRQRIPLGASMGTKEELSWKLMIVTLALEAECIKGFHEAWINRSPGEDLACKSARVHSSILTIIYQLKKLHLVSCNSMMVQSTLQGNNEYICRDH